LLDPIDLLFEGKSLEYENDTFRDLAEHSYEPASSSTLGGFYAYEYLQEASYHVDGYIDRGDVVKMYHESGRPISNDESLRYIFLPRFGNNQIIEYTTPNVMTDERMYLYPTR